MKKIIYIQAIILFFLFQSCSQPCTQNTIEKNYFGYFAESSWKYNFKDDNTYELICEGHVGLGKEGGSYVIQDSLILLIPFTDKSLEDGLKRFKIINKTCIRDFWNNYYYDSIEGLEKNPLNDNDAVHDLSRLINDLAEVKNILNKLKEENSERRPSLIFNGIKRIDKKEYFEFELKSFIPHSIVYLRFYAQSNPQRIYNDDLELLN